MDYQYKIVKQTDHFEIHGVGANDRMFFVYRGSSIGEWKTLKGAEKYLEGLKEGKY